MQLSIYSLLYDKIPENHTLKLIKDAVDFSFINQLLEKSYCKYYSRPAKEPELMVKLLVLQYLYNLSDEQVIQDASLNLAYMYFLNINPDEGLPHPSLLAKFRVHHLQDVSIDEIIAHIVNQCVEKGIIKGTGVSIDTTHSEANTFKYTPERVMKKLAKKIFKSLYDENEGIPASVNQDIPDYKQIDDSKAERAIMKSYLEETIVSVEESVDLENCPKTKELIQTSKEILSDPKFIEQKGVRSIVGQEARVGHKSKTQSFFGYKTEYIMVTEERITTAVRTNNDAYVDGTDFSELIEFTKKSGVTVKEVFGDKAYFRYN